MTAEFAYNQFIADDNASYITIISSSASTKSSESHSFLTEQLQQLVRDKTDQVTNTCFIPRINAYIDKKAITAILSADTTNSSRFRLVKLETQTNLHSFETNLLVLQESEKNSVFQSLINSVLMTKQKDVIRIALDIILVIQKVKPAIKILIERLSETSSIKKIKQIVVLFNTQLNANLKIHNAENKLGKSSMFIFRSGGPSDRYIADHPNFMDSDACLGKVLGLHYAAEIPDSDQRFTVTLTEIAIDIILYEESGNLAVHSKGHITRAANIFNDSVNKILNPLGLETQAQVKINITLQQKHKYLQKQNKTIVKDLIEDYQYDFDRYVFYAYDSWQTKRSETFSRLKKMQNLQQIATLYKASCIDKMLSKFVGNITKHVSSLLMIVSNTLYEYDNHMWRQFDSTGLFELPHTAKWLSNEIEIRTQLWKEQNKDFNLKSRSRLAFDPTPVQATCFLESVERTYGPMSLTRATNPKTKQIICLIGDEHLRDCTCGNSHKIAPMQDIVMAWIIKYSGERPMNFFDERMPNTFVYGSKELTSDESSFVPMKQITWKVEESIIWSNGPTNLTVYDCDIRQKFEVGFWFLAQEIGKFVGNGKQHKSITETFDAKLDKYVLSLSRSKEQFLYDNLLLSQIFTKSQMLREYYEPILSFWWSEETQELVNALRSVLTESQPLPLALEMRFRRAFVSIMDVKVLYEYLNVDSASNCIINAGDYHIVEYKAFFTSLGYQMETISRVDDYHSKKCYAVASTLRNMFDQKNLINL